MDKIHQFYSSIAWRNCREAYKKSVGGLCEECLKEGHLSSAAEVHHIKKITLRNVDDPRVTLSFDNLQALCSRHHDMKHKKRKRYEVDEFGRVTINDDTAPPGNTI